MALYAAFIDWKQAVADWLDVTSGSAYDRLGDYIHLSEIELDRRLRLREAMAFNKTVIDNDGIITLPSDYSQMKTVTVGPECIPLEAVTPDRYLTLRSQTSFEAGQSIYYTIIGEKLNFVPLGSGMDVNISYYRKADPLSDDVPENIYSIYAPEALLAGALKYGFKFLADEERVAIWQGEFNTQVQALNSDAQKAELPSSPLKMRSGVRMSGRRRSF